MTLCNVKVRYHFGVNCYDDEDGTIYLHHFNSSIGGIVKLVMGRPIGMQMSLFHELGHAFVDKFKIFDDKAAIKLFGDFYKDYPDDGLRDSMALKPKARYLTKYCQVHPSEDFADCFAYVLKNFGSANHTNKVIRRKLEYISKRVSKAVVGRG